MYAVRIVLCSPCVGQPLFLKDITIGNALMVYSFQQLLDEPDTRKRMSQRQKYVIKGSDGKEGQTQEGVTKRI